MDSRHELYDSRNGLRCRRYLLGPTKRTKIGAASRVSWGDRWGDLTRPYSPPNLGFCVPYKRLGIFLALPKSHKIDNTQFPIIISKNTLYSAPSSTYNARHGRLQKPHQARQGDQSPWPNRSVPSHPAVPSFLLTNHRLSWRCDSGQGRVHGRSNSLYNPKCKGGW